MNQNIKIDDVLKTVLLFEATFTASLEIKDKELRHQLKQKFNIWFNLTRKLKNHLLEEVKKNSQLEYDYEELAAYVFEVCNIALKTTDFNKIIKILQYEIEKQNKA